MFIKSKKEKDAICRLRGLLYFLEMDRDLRRKLIMSDDEIIHGECSRENNCMMKMKTNLDLTIEEIRAIIKDL